MNKKIGAAVLAALLIALSLAACDSMIKKTATTTTGDSQISTSALAEPSGGDEESTLPATPSTTQDKTTQGATKAPPKAPDVPIKNGGSSSTATESFTSLSQLKSLARRHASAQSGYEMMRKGMLLYPKAGFLSGSPADTAYQGSFNDTVLSYGFSTTLDGSSLDATYSIQQRAYPSHDIRDAITASVINRCIPVSVGGTDYYVGTGSSDGRDTLSVYYFYEDFCITAVFYDPPQTGKTFVSTLESRGFFSFAKTSL